MVLYFGFPLSLEGQFEVINYQNSLMGIFGVRFLIRWLYARFSPQFLVSSPLETLLLGLWGLEGLFVGIGQPWFATHVASYDQLLPYAWFVHTLAIGLAGQEIVRLSNSVVTVQLKPAATLIFSFLFLQYHEKEKRTRATPLDARYPGGKRQTEPIGERFRTDDSR